MTRQLSPKERRTRELASAALRHVRDAEALLPSSPDGAFYLAGYGPECVQKATLSEEWLDRPIGHTSEMSPAALRALDLATSLDPLAHRYARATQILERERWSTASRYQRTGTIDPKRAESFVREARAITDAIVLEMWTDGHLPVGTTPW